MASISLSLNRGVYGFVISDFTVDTQAPNANDIELRWNVLDATSPTPGVITKLDVIQSLEAFRRALESDALILPDPVL